MTVQAKPAKTTRTRCTTCKKQFRPAHASTKFCSDACKTSNRNKGRQVAPKALNIPMSNCLVVKFLAQGQDAGDLTVYNSVRNDVEAIKAMLLVERAAMVANVVYRIKNKSDKSSAFHVGHRAPENGEFVTGHYHADNTFVCPAKANRAHGNKHLNSVGIFTPRIQGPHANTVLSIDKGYNDRAIDYIGRAEFYKACKDLNLQPSTRVRAIAELTKVVDLSNPEHAPFIVLLSDSKSTTLELEAATAAIKGKAAFKPVMKHGAVTPSAVLISEVIRLAHTCPLMAELATICEVYTKDGFYHNNLSTDSIQLLVDVLHGAILSDDELCELKYDLRSPMREVVAHKALLSQRAAEAVKADAILAASNAIASSELLAWSEGFADLPHSPAVQKAPAFYDATF